MFKSKALFIATIDILTVLFFFFFMLSFAALAVISRVTKSGINPGVLDVHLSWSKKADADVDTWFKAPGDPPVGYSNKNGRLCNLIRDDLGRQDDSESRNEEHIICRATPDGEYILNTQLYAVYGDNSVMPIPVTATVTLLSASSMDVIVNAKTQLTHLGDEETLTRFTLHDGKLVPGSVNRIPMELRSATP